jgi:aspartate/methionine/tyrosine aminotransferase
MTWRAISARLHDEGFPTYKAMIQVAGGVGVPVPLRADGASFDMAAFRAAVTPKTRLIVLNSPANPTGGRVCQPSPATSSPTFEILFSWVK